MGPLVLDNCMNVYYMIIMEHRCSVCNAKIGPTTKGSNDISHGYCRLHMLQLLKRYGLTTKLEDEELELIEGK